MSKPGTNKAKKAAAGSIALSKAKARLAEMDKNENKMIVQEFITKFVKCETVYKTLLRDLNSYNGKVVADKDLKINVNTVEATLRFVGIGFKHNDVNAVFGGSGVYAKEGTRSCKKLRDAVMHDGNKKAIEEIVNRKDELEPLMDSFLENFR